MGSEAKTVNFPPSSEKVPKSSINVVELSQWSCLQKHWVISQANPYK